MFVAMTEPQKDVNSVNVASSCMSVLKTNKEGVTFERAFMARYSLHLVGDIHDLYTLLPCITVLLRKAIWEVNISKNVGNLITITTL